MVEILIDELVLGRFEMKIKFYLYFLILLSTQYTALSQEIPVQLMLVDNAGFEKVNHNVKLRLTMSNDTSSTQGQYQEVHLTQSNEYGIISENLGSGVATTNSQVLSLEQFTFLTSEPLIKIELDTSSASNQYYTVGFVPYSYPMVARRALSADSSNYSDQSINSEYADTAEYAKNFSESYDGDTSASNELQELLYSNDTLRLSNSSKYLVLDFKNSNTNCIEGKIFEIGPTSDHPISQAYVIAAFGDTLVVRGFYNSVFGYYRILPSSSNITSIYNSGGNTTHYPLNDGLLVLNTSSGYILKWKNSDNSIDTISTLNSGLSSWSYPRVFLEDSSSLIIRSAANSGGHFKVDIINKIINPLSNRSIYESLNWTVIGRDSLLIGHEVWNFNLTTKLGSYPSLNHDYYWLHPESKFVIAYNLGWKSFYLNKSDTVYYGGTANGSDIIPVSYFNDSLFLRFNATSGSFNNLDLNDGDIFVTDVRSSFSLFKKIGEGSTINFYEFSNQLAKQLYVTYFQGCVDDYWISQKGTVSNILILK